MPGGRAALGTGTETRALGGGGNLSSLMEFLNGRLCLSFPFLCHHLCWPGQWDWARPGARSTLGVGAATWIQCLKK